MQVSLQIKQTSIALLPPIDPADERVFSIDDNPLLGHLSKVGYLLEPNFKIHVDVAVQIKESSVSVPQVRLASSAA
jgi:hypothetical protein